MSHLSYSQVDTLLSCGEKYRITRVLNLQEDPAWWFMGGTAVHTASENFDHGSQLDAATLFENAFNQQLDEVPVDAVIRSAGKPSKDWPSGEDEGWWRHHGPQFVQSWMDWRDANPELDLYRINGEAAIEVAVTCNTEKGVALKGYIDRIFQDTNTGDLLIVDLKTGKTSPYSSLQMDFYRYALKGTLNVHASHGAFWMARKGILSGIHDLWRTDEQIADMLNKARVMVDNELFIPHLGMMCGYCGVNQFCSAYTKNPPIFNITNTKE